MSKIDELVERLCPNGVEFTPLAEIAKIVGGRDYKHLGEGIIPVYGSGGVMAHVDTPAFHGPTVLLPRKGSISNIYYVEGPFWIVDTVFYTIIDQEKMLPRFLYHYILNEHIERLNTSNAARPALTRTVLERIKIPVPPMEIQVEIVRILDSFSKLEAELESKLKAELKGRKSQFLFYLNKLLSYDQLKMFAGEEVLIRHFGDLGQFTRGSGIQKKDFVKSGKPCIHYGQIFTRFGMTTETVISRIASTQYERAKKALPGDVIIAITSENYEDVCTPLVWEGGFPVAISGHSCAFHTELNPRFVAYYMRSEEFSSQKRTIAKGTKVIEVKPSDIAKMLIPTPPYAVQEHVVEILDHFGTLTTSLISSIPAEIEARRKQYEYYRDKLLTFKEKPGD